MLDHPGSPCTFGRCSTARQLVCSEFLPEATTARHPGSLSLFVVPGGVTARQPGFLSVSLVTRRSHCLDHPGSLSVSL